MDESINRSTHDSAPEHGLFVIWETARQFQDQILDNLSARFRVTKVTEIQWTPMMVWANFQRFNSDIGVRGIITTAIRALARFWRLI